MGKSQRLLSAQRILVVAIGLAWGAGCAPPPPPAAPGPPRFPDFLFPTVPEFMANLAIVPSHVAAWRRLQAGELASATVGFSEVLASTASFYPAEAGLGYIDVAARRYDDALARFGAVLERAPAYAPAWVGRGEALLASRREAEALVAFESALGADSALTSVRRRIEVLRFRSVQALLGTAREAEAAERYGAARQAYEQALALAPDSGLVYRGLAAVERRLGELGRALDHVRRANELEPNDADGLILQGEIHELLGDLEGAEAAFARAARSDATPARLARLERIRRRLTAARLPPPYRAIPDNPTVSRAELASLVAVRLVRVLTSAPQDGTVLITDTRAHWADRWILAAAQAGVVEVLPNHTFQPDVLVDRGELAQVVSRVLTLIAMQRLSLRDGWETTREAFSDVGPEHLQYAAASMAVAAGVMATRDGRFDLSAMVSGLEAVSAVGRLEELVDP